jgi:hypothetical protein
LNSRKSPLPGFIKEYYILKSNISYFRVRNDSKSFKCGMFIEIVNLLVELWKDCKHLIVNLLVELWKDCKHLRIGEMGGLCKSTGWKCNSP